MDEELNSAANVEETAEPQIDNETIEATENTEVSAEPTETVDNEPTQTQAFSQRLKEQTQKGIDAHYEQLYGSSNNVHSQADYDRAMQAQADAEQQQQYADAGIDSDMMNKFINENPTVRQAQSIIDKQQNDSKIESEVNELFAAFPDAKDSKIPDDVFMESITKGIPLVYAYSMYANKNAATMAEQKTLRGLQQNAAASPGALNGDQAEKSSLSAMSSKDFNDLTNRVLRGEKINL